MANNSFQDINLLNPFNIDSEPTTKLGASNNSDRNCLNISHYYVVHDLNRGKKVVTVKKSALSQFVKESCYHIFVYFSNTRRGFLVLIYIILIFIKFNKEAYIVLYLFSLVQSVIKPTLSRHWILKLWFPMKIYDL